MVWLNSFSYGGALLGDGSEGGVSEIGRLVGAAADLALLIDDQGLIRDISFRSERLQKDLRGASDWLGRSWAETVTSESRGKVAALLEASQRDEEVRLRHINHPATSGADVAVQYSTIRLRDGKVTAAFGQDLRLFSELQQKLIDAQEALDRDYAALREAQARSRLLFDGTGEALVAVNVATLKIVEFNPAASRLFRTEIRKGRAFLDLFRESSHTKVQRFVTTLQNKGAADMATVALVETGAPVAMSGGMLQSGGTLLMLARITGLAARDGTSLEALNGRLLDALEQSPDAFVFTDGDGLILAANAAFLDMVQLGNIDQVRGRSLGDWLGQSAASVEIDVLLANLRQRGTVRLFSTRLRGQHGAERQVEISAVIVDGGEHARLGFSIRDVARRLTPPAPEPAADAPVGNEHLVDLIGRVPLRDLVRDATDVIERLCIEAALKLTGNNRASASEMLGLSRQSLYVKMRRFGIGNLDDSE
ncbi:transcriptional regulator PpsR [Lichenicoccus roseus]|uniref:Transcriptional regulator PpsR n=1 Tax=Lichenicoccus roseus TaxID=2683649 RepID=A0A5R9JF83_9PROT|nr:transcriptional regulator PpsR [Lichenicoccus roseus]